MKLGWILCGALVVAIAACGSDVAAPVAGGTFSLRSVDGALLPFRSGNQITVRGSLVLESGKGFLLLQNDSATVGGTVGEFRVSGSWALTENAVTLSGPTGSGILYLGVVYGAIDSVRLTMGAHTNTYVR